MGIWSSLTTQGKLAVVAVVIGGFFLLGLITNGAGGGGDGGSGLPNRLTSTSTPGGFVVSQPTQTNQTQNPTPQTSPGATTTAQASPEASATGAAPTATSSDAEPTATTAAAQSTNTPVVVPPTATSPPPPPPPTETPVPPGCVVSGNVALSDPPGTETVSGSILCGGAPGAGAGMSAILTYQNLGTGCAGQADAGGNASCGANVAGLQPGNLTGVEVCFNHNGERYCTAVPF